jgi:hypothetical protein
MTMHERKIDLRQGRNINARDYQRNWVIMVQVGARNYNQRKKDRGNGSLVELVSGLV